MSLKRAMQNWIRAFGGGKSHRHGAVTSPCKSGSASNGCTNVTNQAQHPRQINLTNYWQNGAKLLLAILLTLSAMLTLKRFGTLAGSSLIARSRRRESGRR